MSLSHGLQLFTNCSSVGPPRGHKPCQQTCSGVGFSLSPWVCRSWQKPSPAWAPHRVTASFRHPPALAWGPLHRLQVDICSTVDLHGLKEDSLPHHGLHRLHGKILHSSISSTGSPSFFPDLGVCRALSLTSSHFSLSTAISQQVFPLLKYVIT